MAVVTRRRQDAAPMEEEETQIKFCRTMICLLRSKQQQHLESTEEERRRRHGGRERSECEDRDQFAEQTSPSVIIHQSPQVQPVPTQLISTLRLKSLEEKMRRAAAAAEVELHDPAVCSVCEQEQASLALKTFIRRKKTQLQVQTLKRQTKHT
ncbi:hypothetical protein E3U43_001801 [Larimichthys crocea]|uniref:Uncharacterized protein n=1 Tax=Larimichthys crocea TaxID=215358 RepID=A0ACD3REH2_LARCR|nr:hypothetical protein E3U43_001801 [Larimichthys crocea]